MYDTDVGLIIAYSQQHADEMAQTVLEDEVVEHAFIQEMMFRMEN